MPNGNMDSPKGRREVRCSFVRAAPISGGTGGPPPPTTEFWKPTGKRCGDSVIFPEKRGWPTNNRRLPGHRASCPADCLGRRARLSRLDGEVAEWSKALAC